MKTVTNVTIVTAKMYAPTTKGELARAYAPQLTPEAARKRLYRWMNACPPLMNALRKTGYSETQKKISGRQKYLIYRYLGRPIDPGLMEKVDKKRGRRV